MTTAANHPAPDSLESAEPSSAMQSAAPRPFQFGIRDVVIVTTLAAMLLAGIAQFNPLLLLTFFVATSLALIFQWRFSVSSVVLLAVGVISAFCLLMPATYTPPEVPRRMHCGNNLKQIGLALQNYHDIYETFPPAYIVDANGKPMHSWRVLILPYLEQQALYDQYRFDEPWDGPNNRLLAGAIMKVYSCPSARNQPWETSYVAIVGPGTAWPGGQTLTYQDFPDGTSNVLQVVEVHQSGIHWMEPRDLDATQLVPSINPPTALGISSGHPSGANVLLVDGAVRFLKNDTPPETLRSLIRRDDGVAPWPD